MQVKEFKGIELQCCFCSNGIRTGVINPCNLSILSNVDKTQGKQSNQLFFCHAECFKLALHNDAQKECILKNLTT
jgi:hypothetical protein